MGGAAGGGLLGEGEGGAPGGGALTNSVRSVGGLTARMSTPRLIAAALGSSAKLSSRVVIASERLGLAVEMVRLMVTLPGATLTFTNCSSRESAAACEHASISKVSHGWGGGEAASMHVSQEYLSGAFEGVLRLSSLGLLLKFRKHITYFCRVLKCARPKVT